MTTSVTDEAQLPRVEAAATTLADTIAPQLSIGGRTTSDEPLANVEPILGSSAQLLTTDEKKRQTVFYLAYGSNLCKKTFRGRRGIRPLGATNVVVPELRLTFDLPGVPYMEPCFGNTAERTETQAAQGRQLEATGHSCKRCEGNCQYLKDTWHKGLVGVVYELTLADFAHVMATEGGGTAYKDVKVTCYALPPDMDKKVSWDPAKDGYEEIDAHTLFAPPRRHRPKAIPNTIETRGGPSRPDPGFAQPSQRYLGLIKAGVDEHKLPNEYRDYVARIRPYRITHFRQRLGQAFYTVTFLPVFLIMQALTVLTADKKGRAPPWLTSFMSSVFGLVWRVYDGFGHRLFGEGERTDGEGKVCECECHDDTDTYVLDEKSEPPQSLV